MFYSNNLQVENRKNVLVKEKKSYKFTFLLPSCANDFLEKHSLEYKPSIEQKTFDKIINLYYYIDNN